MWSRKRLICRETMITDFVRPTEAQLKYTMHFENHSLPFGNRELWNMCKIPWSPLTKSPLSSMQTDATFMLANNAQLCQVLHLASVCKPCYNVIACSWELLHKV